MIPKSSVDRYNYGQSYKIKLIFLYTLLTKRVGHAMMLIAHCSFFFAALQFVAITRYYASLRLAKKKEQCTLNIIQLRILG
ncbi:hypothetical protein SAMN05421690_10156 [Nitrosomonas sp. Nm51]|nr:hypothetical protein SAMN05421690_10156 [Nitrosomonas sp. Nm51]